MSSSMAPLHEPRTYYSTCSDMFSWTYLTPSLRPITSNLGPTPTRLTQIDITDIKLERNCSHRIRTHFHSHYHTVHSPRLFISLQHGSKRFGLHVILFFLSLSLSHAHTHTQHIHTHSLSHMHAHTTHSLSLTCTTHKHPLALSFSLCLYLPPLSHSA